jgi:hypothetical protein
MKSSSESVAIVAEIEVTEETEAVVAMTGVTAAEETNCTKRAS